MQMKMNNKGQALVFFVLLLPLIVMLIAFVFETGRISLIKMQYEDCVYDAISYALNNIDGDDTVSKTELLLSKNINGTFNVSIDGDVVFVHVTSSLDGMFSKTFKNNYDINLKYKGYLDDGIVKVVKE